MNHKEIYTHITEEILQKLKEGIIPWRKSWKSGVPLNYITKKPYRGINFLSLITKDYPSPYYLTFLQCNEKEGRVHKGERGHLIVYWSIKEILDEEENKKSIPIIRYSYVFNLAQTSLYEDKSEELKLIDCEEILSKIKDRLTIKHNISQCYYNKREDIISIPRIESFESREEYYSSLFHELIHWTGHKDRLNRNYEYAFEELIAELGSAYLCGITGISNQTIDNQVSYIKEWMRVIESNNKSLLKAAAEAQRAINYITNQNQEEQQ